MKALSILDVLSNVVALELFDAVEGCQRCVPSNEMPWPNGTCGFPSRLEEAFGPLPGFRRSTSLLTSNTDTSRVIEQKANHTKDASRTLASDSLLPPIKQYSSSFHHRVYTAAMYQSLAQLFHVHHAHTNTRSLANKRILRAILRK